MIGTDLCVFQIIYLDQCFQPRCFCMGQLTQSFFYNNPVFSLKIHNIAYCSHCCQLCKCENFFCWNSCIFIHNPDQFPCNYSSAEIFVWIWAVLLFGIDYCICRWNDPFSSIFCIPKRNIMMIGNHHCHP